MPQTHDTASPPVQDALLRFLLPAAGVRGVAVRLDDTWRTIASRASYPAAAAELLGEAAAAAALFTGHAKVDGRLSVQLRSGGAIRTLFAECTAAGTLRGIVRLDPDAPAPSRDLRALGDGALHTLFAECSAAGTVRGIVQCEAGRDIPRDLTRLGDDALLAITIENPGLDPREPQRYQSLVALHSPTLAGAFEDYFRQSEQLPTRLLLACDGARAAGLMLQKLPGDGGDDDGWNRVGALFETLGSAELLALAPADTIHRLFHEESPHAMGGKPLRFACSCSRERVAAMLVSLGIGEAEAAVAAGDGEARVLCEFCGHDYRFDAEAVASLFRGAGAALPAAPGIQ